MRGIPMLAVSSQERGFLLINGQLACEVDGLACLPVSPSGDVFLLFVPYEGSPIAQKLSFHAGALLTGDSPNPLTVWPDGVIELDFTRDSAALKEPARVLDEIELADANIRLVKDGGLYILCQDALSGEQLLRHEMPMAKSGLLRRFDEPFETAAALVEENGLQRLVLINATENGLAVGLDTVGTDIRLDLSSARSYVTTDMGDVAGHVANSEFALEKGGARLIKEAFAWKGGAATAPVNDGERCRALLQALMLGLDGEAHSYLSPEYRASVSIDELKAFFGVFTEITEPKFAPASPLEGETAALLTPTAQNVTVARIFAFECAEGGITSISQYTPD